MKGVLYLAWRSVLGHKVRSLLLIVALMLTMVLPWTAHVLLARFERDLSARAAATPLVAGTRGSRFDLVLKALYFRPTPLRPLTDGAVATLDQSGLCTAIPLHLRYTAGGFPLIGTSPEYFAFRGLTVERGALPAYLGEAVLGAEAAAKLQLAMGATLITDPVAVYDISKSYPLKLHITGVLKRMGTPDDAAVFVDLHTAWIVDGITHGHQDVTVAPANVILERRGNDVKTNAAIVEYTEVTPENLASFHTHGDPGGLPVTAIIAVPRDEKSATLLKARYAEDAALEVVAPKEVVDELLGLVFRIKAFFDFSFAIVLVSAVLFLAVVLLLTRQARRRERETMHRLGCSRWTVAQIHAAELGMLVAASAVLAFVTAQAAQWAIPGIVRIL